MRIELIAEIDGQKVKGLSQMKALADKGNVEALNLLGEWMMMGFECSPDPDFYVACFKEAARKGNTQGMLNLAVCYMEERGVPADFYAAERWIRAAIECGDREGIELFKELYLTTIGNHKPDVRAYVHTMKTFDPSGSYLGDSVGGFERFWMSEEELEQRLIAGVVLGSRGKSVKEIRKLKGKITDADIEGYARLQDIHHDETAATPAERDCVADKARTISDIKAFVPGADREQLFLAVRAIMKMLPSGKRVKGNPIESAQRCKQIHTEAPEFNDVLKVLEGSLSWKVKATFNLDEALFSKFESNEVADLATLICQELDRIENEEILLRYEKTNQDWKALKELLAELKATKYYSSDIVSQWNSKIKIRIAELQNQEIENRFSIEQNNYSVVVELYNFANNNQTEPSVKEAWREKLRETAVSLQHKELDRLCENLGDKQLNALYRIENEMDKYNFDEKTLSIYRTRLTTAIEGAQDKHLANKFNAAQHSYDALVALHAEVVSSKEYLSAIKAEWREKIASAIKVVQQGDLAQLLSSIDTLEYAELIKLYQKAQHFSFDKDVLSSAIKPLDELIDKKEQAHLADLCGGIENYSPSKLKVLEERINALHYRDKNTKKPLAKIKGLIKDNGVLDKCTPSRLVNYEPDQLDELMKEVHFSSLPKEEKERIFALIAQQREANENYEAEILQIAEDSKLELVRFIKAAFSNINKGINSEFVRIYSDDKTIHTYIKNVAKNEWQDDEESLVYLKISNRLNWLITTKAIRQDDGYCWLTEYKTTEVVGDESSSIYVRTLPGVERHGTYYVQAHAGSEWTKEVSNTIARAVDSVVRKIKSSATSKEQSIRALRNKHQNESTLLGSDGASAFTAFAQRYNPYSIIDFSAEQVAESMDAVQQSNLSDVEKKAIFHILNDAERYKRKASDAVATYDKNFLASTCKGIRGIATKYLGVIPPMIYNDAPADFRKGIDNIKAQYDNSPVHKADYDDLLKNGICILMCGGRGAGKSAFLVFKRYALYYYSAADAHTSTGWGILQYAHITKIMYNRVGFTHAPEIAIFDKDDDRHYNGVSVTGQSADTVEKMAALCKEVVDYLGDEIIIRKDNAREDDRKAIMAYFEKARKDLTAFYADAWESIVLASGSLSQAQFSEYLNMCIESETQYYETNPLNLSYDYYTLKKPSTFQKSQPKSSATHTAQPKANAQPAKPNSETSVEDTSSKQVTGNSKRQLAVLDKAKLEQVAKQLNISHILDFENVDIQTFLDANRGYEKSGQKVQEGEFGVVLIKNNPEPLLLTNTSYYSAQCHFGKPELYHSHPTIESIPFHKYKVAYSRVCKANVLKYDYRETINGVTPHMEGEIPTNMDKETLERVLQFLIYAAYGTQPSASGTPINTATSTNQQVQGSAPITAVNAPSQNAVQVAAGTLSQYGTAVDKSLDINQQLIALLQQYGNVVSIRTFLAGSISYEKKIQKAVAAYAPIKASERPLLMEDFTVFGSAKEGFVWTTENIYQKDSFEAKLVCPISEIREVRLNPRSKDLFNVDIVTASKSFRISTRATEADAIKVAEFYNDVWILVKQFKGGNEPQNKANQTTPTPTTVSSTTSTNAGQWLCECGKINVGNFCSSCGKKKETGKPLWTCSCGSVNKGKFCSKCGSPKKED